MKNLVGKMVLMVCLAAMVVGCRRAAVDPDSPVTLRVGHVGHDHHLALYVALDQASQGPAMDGITLRTARDRQLYSLYDGARKLADVEIVQVGGGARMPTALAQGIIDVGLGGVAPVLGACDRGAPVRLIAPLHTRGNMLVVRPDLAVDSWPQLLERMRRSDPPFRMGYKSPMAVAKLIFEDTLRREGIAYGGDPTRDDPRVLMVNLKDDANLNRSLADGLVDGYVGNNPYPAIAAEKGIGRILCDLEEVAPERFRDHPCCCLAANRRSIEGKEEAVVAFLALLMAATKTIQEDEEAAVRIACRWIGTSEGVERSSIPTSGYSMRADAAWRGTMAAWFAAMNDLETFEGGLKGLEEEEAAAVAYDLDLLRRAERRFERGYEPRGSLE